MIITPQQAAQELAEVLKQMREEVQATLPAGERLTIRVQFFDCVPFDIEIIGQKK